MYKIMKRLIDITAAVLGLLILAPLMSLIGAAIYLNMGSPIFFRQTRPGKHGQPFEMIKFRTMTDAHSNSGDVLPDKDRLTKLGRFLRSTSMDELPELLNVLKGDMSVVGPRPLLMEYVPLYTAEQYRRMSIRPGITGWAQINGRNALSWEQKFDLDTWYVDNQSTMLDIKIILLTFIRIVRREGINSDGEATATKFTGTKS